MCSRRPDFSAMHRIIIILAIFANVVNAGLEYTYEGDCLGRDIPENYFSLVSSDKRVHEINKDELYAVMCVKNKTKSSWCVSMEFETPLWEREKIRETILKRGKERGVIDFYLYRVFVSRSHYFFPGDAYRIFVPIPLSCINKDSKIRISSDLVSGEEESTSTTIFRVPLSSRRRIAYPAPEYSGIMVSARMRDLCFGEITLRCRGRAPSLFVYSRSAERPAVLFIVQKKRGDNLAVISDYDIDDVEDSKLVQATLLPGDEVASMLWNFKYFSLRWKYGAENKELRKPPSRWPGHTVGDDIYVFAQSPGLFQYLFKKADYLKIDEEEKGKTELDIEWNEDDESEFFLLR